jgi:pullulanase
MTLAADIQADLTFLTGLEANVVGYTIDNSPNGEAAKALCVIYNANKSSTTVTIPEGDWNVYVKGNKAGTEILQTIPGGSVIVDPISALVLVQEDAKAAPTETPISAEVQDTTADSTDDGSNNSTALLIVSAAVIAAAGIAVWMVIRYRKRKK